MSEPIILDGSKLAKKIKSPIRFKFNDRDYPKGFLISDKNKEVLIMGGGGSGEVLEYEMTTD